MSDNVGRIFGALGALAALWIGVYWWWEPRPRISMDTGGPASASAAPISQSPVPVPPPPRVVEPTPAAVHSPTASPAAAMAVVPPRFRDYTIQKGDTMESIAQRELGSRRLADALRSANALMDPDHLKPGRTMRIPLDPGNIQGKPVVPDPVAANPAPTPPPAESGEYIVKSGDTLSGIAKAKYGSTKFKDFLYESNKDRLSGEDDLREGQKLRIPSKPAP